MELIERIRRRAIEHGCAIADNSPVIAKRAIVKGASADVGKRLVQGIATTAAPDMDDEVIVPNFDMSYFDAMRAVYLEHNYDRPIGTNRNYRAEADGWYTTTYIASTAMGDEILTLIAEGVVRGLSVGVVPLEMGPPTPEEQNKYGGCRNVIRKSLMLEYSVTAMPANPQALIDAVSKGLVRRATAVTLGMEDTPERKFHPTVVVPAKKKICILE